VFAEKWERRSNTEGAEEEHRGHREEKPKSTGGRRETQEAGLKDQRYIEE
jgi:hypothetical protein